MMHGQANIKFIIAVLNMDFALRHSCGAYNFEVAPIFFFFGKFMGLRTCKVLSIVSKMANVMLFISSVFVYEVCK